MKRFCRISGRIGCIEDCAADLGAKLPGGTAGIAHAQVFDTEFRVLARAVQTALAAKARLLESIGPMLGRSHVDTLKKELRFDAANGVWRVAFAFDIARQAVVLVAGDKSGGSEAQFLRSLIATANKRFDDHLARQKKGG